MVKSERGPYPSDESVPSTSIIPNTIMHETALLNPLALSTATIVSTREMDDVSAAKNTRMKNTMPSHLPPMILLNTAGSWTNISEGPDCVIAFWGSSE